jgi:hypothetical protein
MAKRHTLKNRKSLRRKSLRLKRRANGGGWSELPLGQPFDKVAVNPGNQIHMPFTGPGKDCTGNPYSYRPGYIFGYDPKGLPGLSGGGKRKGRKVRGGAAMPGAASVGAASVGPVTNPSLPPVSGSVTPKPGDFPATTGAGGTVANPNNLPVVMSMPGVPPLDMAKMPIVQLSQAASDANLAPPKQSGGRYGFFPGMGPLNPVNGVGTTPGPFGRIPCEGGTYNPLNPDPSTPQGPIQTMSTAPLTPRFVTGRLAGGNRRTVRRNRRKSGGGLPAGTSYAASSANFPVVQVGQVDSMRYYAPTAGYRNDFMTFQAPSPVPGLTIQTPYAAKAFNQACIKTGGSYKGGALPVAMDAGTFTPVKLDEVWTRYDFDGSRNLLPVKFGGKRSKSSKRSSSRRAKKTAAKRRN